MQTPRDRIRLYIAYLGVTVSAFERTCGVSHGFVRNIRRAPSPSACSQIALAYPDLNLDWILTGRGGMLLSEPEGKPHHIDSIERLLKIISERDECIRELLKENVLLTNRVSELENILNNKL